MGLGGRFEVAIMGGRVWTHDLDLPPPPHHHHHHHPDPPAPRPRGPHHPIPVIHGERGRGVSQPVPATARTFPFSFFCFSLAVEYSRAVHKSKRIICCECLCACSGHRRVKGGGCASTSPKCQALVYDILPWRKVPESGAPSVYVTITPR